MITSVYKVDEIYVGITIFDGINLLPGLVVAAKGKAITGGWSDAFLAPRYYIAPPEDGIQDFDFYATPPSSGTIVIQALTDIASKPLLMEMPTWLRGVRVHAASNNIQQVMSGQTQEILSTPKGLPLPCPFPW